MEKTFEPGIFRKRHAGLPEKGAEDTKGRNQVKPPRPSPKHPESPPAPPTWTLLTILVDIVIAVVLLGTRKCTAYSVTSSAKRAVRNLSASGAIKEQLDGLASGALCKTGQQGPNRSKPRKDLRFWRELTFIEWIS
jgi:hypothetical protein